jgi:transposase
MSNKEEFKGLVLKALEKQTKEELAKKWQVSLSTIDRWISGHSVPMNFIIEAFRNDYN